MKYYRAKDDFYNPYSGWTAIQNELLTEKERQSNKYKHLKDTCFDVVEILKFKTYMSFGVRLEEH